MTLREDIEDALRAWNAYEIGRNAPPVIDFDCHPSAEQPPPAQGRLAVRHDLVKLLSRTSEMGSLGLTERLRASLAYLDALLGVREPLGAYVEATQGCAATGWPVDYIAAVGDLARSSLANLGIAWDSSAYEALERIEEPLDAESAPDVIRSAARDFEPAIRDLVDSQAPFDLTIEHVDLDAYWAYWLDGSGSRVRMRINRKHAQFTTIQAQQFALHEILGHGLQCASYSHQCATGDVPWIRLTAVHAQQQVMLEGLAQALPLFLGSTEERLTSRVRLAHYLELVRSEVHLAINAGASVAECVELAHERVPFWTDERIADALADRSVNPLLRSYLWAYPAGIDWFVNLADQAPADTVSNVLRSAYREPLTPADLMRLWPDGPSIGGVPASTRGSATR